MLQPSGPLPCWGFLEEPFPLSTTNVASCHFPTTAPSPKLSPEPRSGPEAVAMVVAPTESSPIAIDRAAETVAVVERPGYQQATVTSQLVYSDDRRYKEQVDFRPVLHPVKYSDTAFLWINSSRRRYVSRTFCEPRVRPRAYSDTTFVRPKTAEQRFVSTLDIRSDTKRKWFKTSVEIKPRTFTSSKVIRSPNNNYIGTDTSSATTAINVPNGTGNNERDYQNNDIPLIERLTDDREPNGYGPPSESAESNGFAERLDPGASQVYIPRRLKHPIDEHCLVNGDILLDLPNGHFMDR
ncbi:family with sequence similarity 101, member A [Elysia marginata]|uniref:Family with sequence similarity 101, member A n=1 Tax=Elysia marginata TaxID=1093978 RepID=A0AAV4HHQ4_9GAST|nr:family with sequence similarity 101, member A [Elysia marginata]